MKILLTGSHGFIGTHFRKESGFDESDIICWDTKIGKDISQLVIADLHEVDVIVHLAAHISVPHSYDMPEEYLLNNTYHTLRLINRAVKAGVSKFIFASSSSVYGDPLSPYGASKLSAEKFLDVYKGKIDLKILRFFNVYGLNQNPQYAGVITNFMEALERGRPIVINGDGEQRRDFLFVEDLVHLIKNAIEDDESISGPIDVGTGTNISINELAKLMKEIWDKDVPITYAPAREEIRTSKANNVEAKKMFVNFTQIGDGLQKLYEAIHNNNN